jgi:hypothetical protein
MRVAPVEETIFGGHAALSGNGEVELGAPVSGSASVSSAATIAEETDSRDGTRTDRLTAIREWDGALVVDKKPWSTAGEVFASAAVTRDKKTGEARSMTLQIAFDDKPGKIPELVREGGRVPLAAAASPPPTRGEAGDRTAMHRYEAEVKVDLTDPRNADLRKKLSTDSGLAGRLDEDNLALEHARHIDRELLARSEVTVLEQVPSDDSCEVSVGGVVGVKAGTTTSSYRTVAAWQTVGETFRPVQPRG